MSQSYGLSKSRYLKGLQCLKALWLQKHRPELAAEITPELQARFDMGHEVGFLAQKCFPEGVEVTEDYTQIKEAAAKTVELINDGAEVLYEAAVIYNNVLARIDIFKKAGPDSWDMIEVKASAHVKDINLHDVALQRYVFEGSGYNIRKTFLMHLNRDYVRKGDLDIHQLFTLEDITAAARNRMPGIADRINEMLAVLKQKKCPCIEIGDHCSNPYECDFKEHCWQHIPEDSIYSLVRLTKEKRNSLRDRDIIRIQDIPDSFDLSNSQELQKLSITSSKPLINRKKIAGFLSELEYPLYFLDFEVASPGPPIPAFDGTRPFSRIPFQFSLHIQEKPEQQVKHKEFLAFHKNDPRRDFAKELVQCMGKKGSVIVYNTAFEKSIMDQLAAQFPEYSKKLTDICSRLWDMLVPFRSRWYVHPEFP